MARCRVVSQLVSQPAIPPGSEWQNVDPGKPTILVKCENDYVMKKNTRSKWLHLRVSPEEYQKLQKSFEGTTCRKLSEYMRNLVFQKPNTVYFRNRSADEFLDIAIKLKEELNRIGNNLNQVVKRINTFLDEKELSSLLFSLEINRKIMLQKMEEIKNKMNQIFQLLLVESNERKLDKKEPAFTIRHQMPAANQHDNKFG